MVKLITKSYKNNNNNNKNNNNNNNNNNNSNNNNKQNFTSTLLQILRSTYKILLLLFTNFL